MLQLKQIAQVLSQGLTPVKAQEVENTGTSSKAASALASPLSISLLSSSGIPLTTVTSEDFDTHNLSVDNVKIYSLLGVNYLKQQADPGPAAEARQPGDEVWEILQVESGVTLAVKKLNYTEDTSEANDLYVVIFYDESLLNSVAKLKLDNICSALNDGLKGYKKEV